MPELVLTVSPALEVAHTAASDSFAALHALLERQGQLDHSFEDCP